MPIGYITYAQPPIDEQGAILIYLIQAKIFEKAYPIQVHTYFIYKTGLGQSVSIDILAKIKVELNN